MQDTFSFLEEFLGREGADRLGRARIAVFGVGSVGSYVAETLARCGVGSLTLVDHGKIRASSITRQLEALQSTIGMSKVQALKDRIVDIDQDILVHTYESFFDANTRMLFDLKAFDYIVDTIGDISGKLLLIETSKEQKIPLLSCMGICGRTDPQKLAVADISRTRVCPVSKIIRTELRKKGIHDVKVLFSREQPISRDSAADGEESLFEERIPTIAYMPGIAGMLIAHEVIRDLLQQEERFPNKKAVRPFGLAIRENRLYNSKLPRVN